MSVRGPYVDRLEVQDFFCIKHVDVKLTPLHAFIGPNDSGKSTLLRAIASISSAKRFPRDASAAPVAATISVYCGPNYCVIQQRDDRPRGARTYAVLPGHQANSATVDAAIDEIQLVRLDPDALRTPSILIPSSKPLTFSSSRGEGLPSVCDAIIGRDTEAWIRLRDRFVELFPTVKTLEIRNADGAHKTLAAVLRTGERVDASAMSEGMLYWLAFAAMSEAERPSIFLVEEPENGLHPSRISEVVALLRHVSKTAQVIIATHSPLVINELQPEEISIVTRPPDKGTQVTPMTATKNFAQRSKVYALGELWLSYADGDLEAELTGPSDEAGTKASA